MSNELNLSVGVSPRFFVRLDGWTDPQIADLVHQTRNLPGVTKAAASGGSGMYVDYSVETTDQRVKDRIRQAAASIISGLNLSQSGGEL